MTPQEGKKKLAKLFGARALWRDSGRPTSAEARAEAAERARLAAADFERLKAERDALAKRLLAVPEYQEIARATAAARDAKERAFGEARNFRLSVGRNAGGFFMIEAQGDNWADAIRKLEEKGGAK